MRAITVLILLLLAAPIGAQTKTHVSGGEVSFDRLAHVDAARLARRFSGADSAQLARLPVGGDSAQRIAMADYDWRGRVMSVEFDSADARAFWDVKIVPDSSDQTIVRYRVDATRGGIMDVREFGGLRGLKARDRP